MLIQYPAAGIFKVIQPHLSFETSLKERKYAFKDRCSRQVEMNETIKLPSYVKIISLPEEKNNDGSICSFKGSYSLSGTNLTVKTKVTLGKRVYEAQDWPEFRDVVNAQNSLTEEPVIFQISH